MLVKDAFDIHVHLHMDDLLMDEHVEIARSKGVSGILVHGVPNDLCPPLGDNDEVPAAMEKHPDFVCGSMHIDLRNGVEKNIDIIRRYAEQGFKCVKMYPNLGFNPSEPIHDPVWAEIEKQGLMFLSHCGYISISEKYPRLSLTSVNSSPYSFERPARMFHGINFIMAHFGGAPTYLETIILCMRIPNMYADCTPGQGTWVWQRRLPGIEDMPFSKFLWGTDSTHEAIDGSFKFWQETFDDMNISEEDRDLFYRTNARKLLNI